MSERKGQRIDASVGVIVRHQGAADPCLSHSLSSGGIFLGTQKRWPVGTVVQLEIVHQDKHIPVEARVASHIRSGVGLEFLEMSAEVRRSLEALIAHFIHMDPGSRVVPEAGRVKVAWSLPHDGVFWHVRHNRHRSGQLIDISLDGAAITAKSRPDVDTEVIVYLTPMTDADGSAQEVESRAQVVRHTDRGFAVKFVSPSMAFRRVISELRKAARLDH